MSGTKYLVYSHLDGQSNKVSLRADTALDLVCPGKLRIGSAAAPTADLDVAGTTALNDNVTVAAGKTLTVDTNTLHVDATNHRLGVGTTRPAQKLDVNGIIKFTTGVTGNEAFIGDSTYSGYAVFCHKDLNSGTDYSILHKSVTGHTHINAKTNAYIDFRINNSQKMLIDTNGKVGIGTIAPISNLHVYQTTKSVLDVNGEANIVLDCEDSTTHQHSHGSGISFRQRWWTGNTLQVATGAIHSYKDTGGGGFGGGLLFYYGSAGSSNLSLAMYYGRTGQVVFPITINNGSDDRLKENEEYITGATNTLKKLKPQLYDKHTEMAPRSQDSRSYKESGLIAQEVYYDAPELRHLVTIGGDATPADSIPTSSDPTSDPDYSSWGTESASLNYVGLIPFLVRSNTELSDALDAERTKVATLEAEIAAIKAHIGMS